MHVDPPVPVPIHAALDPRLAEAAGRGEAAALAELARRCRPILRAQARSALAGAARRGQASDAVEELVAEVEAFLAAGAPGDAAPGWCRFVAGRSRTIEGWLYGIVRNKARHKLRDVRRHRDAVPRLAAPAATTCDLAHVETSLDAARALWAARELPARERAALALWLEGASSRDIAARLRFASAHAVDCCLARGRSRLRGLLLGEEAPRAA